jgi:hypothetical protein
MKTPEEWQTYFAENLMHHASYPVPPIDFIEMVQRDALSDTMANTTDQQELEIAKSIAYNSQIRADQLHEQMMKWREKYHEARRYLRASNKGATRNAQALELMTFRFNALMKRYNDYIQPS